MPEVTAPSSLLKSRKEKSFNLSRSSCSIGQTVVMKTFPKVIAVVGVVAIGMVALAGCGGRGDRDGHPGNVMIQGAVDRGVTVQATGTIKVVPDGVSFNFSVTALTDSTATAVSQTSDAAAMVRDALDAQGVAKDDIATQNATVYPEYSYLADGTSSLKGYRGQQVFVVTLRDAAKAGEVVDAVVAAGGNALQISSVTPTLLDTDAAAADARDKAVSSAKSKAEAYAKLLGVDLGDVVYVTEVAAPANFVPNVTADKAVGAAESAPTQIDLGLQEVSVTIEVRWSLK
ncbi:MAG: DUF541 domain-containing protein [Actinobacteria bacterium]|nr:MAG: DUF541 domain-containing protein [Actinomycetota bacterium]